MNRLPIAAGLKYLLQAGEYERILAEFEKRSITKVINNNPGFILEVFRHIPDEVKYRYPIGYINYAYFYAANVDREGGLRPFPGGIMRMRSCGNNKFQCCFCLTSLASFKKPEIGQK